MNYKVIVLGLVAVLISSCAAFDSDEKVSNPKDPNADIVAKVGNFEGVFEGTKVVKENNCDQMRDEVGKSVKVKYDVLQSGSVANVKFEDGKDLTATVKDKKIELVKKAKASTSIIALSLKGEGEAREIEGVEDYFEVPEGTELTKACAKYELKLKMIDAKSQQKVEEKK